MQAVVGRIGVHFQGQTGGIEEAIVLTGQGQRDYLVGDAVADEHAELADAGQPKQRAAVASVAAVQ